MRRPIRHLAAAAIVAATALAVTACTTDQPPSSTTTTTPGSATTTTPVLVPTLVAPTITPSDKPVTYALMPGQAPTWIAPLTPAEQMSTANSALHALFWVPLFQYDGAAGEFRWDKPASIATDYSFSADGTAVTITLGAHTWSDGTPVTARDVEFAYNLAKANKEAPSSDTAGLYPDSVTRFQAVDDKHLTVTFDAAYNPEFVLANQLSLITPLPQHAWDIDAPDHPVGDYDRTTDGARAVWQYIQSRAANVADPMWQVVDGPYTLSAWADDGSISLSANTKYTGLDTPSIATVHLKPYASDAAELGDLRAGAIDYGYITAGQLDSFDLPGYTVKPWAGWSITYAPYNFGNPDMGPVFRQLYARQGLQSAIDQPTLSAEVWKGAALPGYGPIPQGSPSDYLSADQTANPYPYDLAAAEKYFTDNGWKKGDGGILACVKPGNGKGQCGEGIAAGKQMRLSVTTQNESGQSNAMMAAIKAALAQIGVDLTIQEVPLDKTRATALACKSGSDCSWQLVFFGAAGSWYFPAYPVGQALFGETAQWNCGQWYDPDTFALIDDMLTSADTSIAQAYSAHLARALPVLWLPNPVYQISAVRDELSIATQDPGGRFMPQRWTWLH